MSNLNDDNDDTVEPDTGGAAPETPEGQELAPDPDGSDAADERAPAGDPETTNLRATEEESSNNEWAP